MKRKKFLKAKEIDESLSTVNRAIASITRFDSFKDNHEAHGIKLMSCSEDKGSNFEVGGRLFDSKDMGKITNVVADILASKKMQLEKEFAEI